MSASYQVGLRVHSGVPVVDMRGRWEPGTAGALEEMVQALSQAGHYEIVVNIQRVELDGLLVMQSLARVARCVREHCGHIGLVGTAEQLHSLWRQQAEGLCRLAASEERAIAHIKRSPVLVAGQRQTARTRP